MCDNDLLVELTVVVVERTFGRVLETLWRVEVTVLLAVRAIVFGRADLGRTDVTV